MSLLKVDSLNVTNLYNDKKIINNLSFSIESNTCLAIVGESGSGKSMTCKAILGLTDPWIKVEGNIYLNNKKININDSEKMRNIRSKNISMILQDAITAFDPLYTIGHHIRETLCGNLKVSKKDADEIGIDIMDKLGIHNAKTILTKYPHQLSGGMLQRCMISIAIATKPDVIIADEPTTALDSINQKEVVEQFEMLQRITGTAILFISHDLGVVQRLADKILVIKDGVKVDYDIAENIFRNPKSEHTRYLLETRIALSQAFNKIINGKEARDVKSTGCL